MTTTTGSLALSIPALYFRKALRGAGKLFNLRLAAVVCNRGTKWAQFGPPGAGDGYDLCNYRRFLSLDIAASLDEGRRVAGGIKLEGLG